MPRRCFWCPMIQSNRPVYSLHRRRCRSRKQQWANCIAVRLLLMFCFGAVPTYGEGTLMIVEEGEVGLGDEEGCKGKVSSIFFFA
jgi:hypothetical protein